MLHLDTTPGRTALINGREHLFFSGYNYLGMDHVPEFQALIKEGIDKYGWLFPSSRISNTRLELFEKMEALLAAITGTPTTVLFSSGFLAGRAIASLFPVEDVAVAPYTHPALSASSAYNETEWLQQAMIKSILFFDTVNPLTATVRDIALLNQLPHPVTCIADDSHGIGILNNGSGFSKNFTGIKNILFALSYSLSKAFNLTGGAVSCTEEIAAVLRNSPFYTASTSIPPAFVYAFIHGQKYYSAQQKKLQENIQYFQQRTGNRFTSHRGLPIFILPAGIDVARLQNAGIIISSFAYPNPGGTIINRIVINALHTQEDMDTLASVID